jgi:hypothetical protein
LSSSFGTTIEGLYEFGRMLVVEIVSLTLYLFPIFTLFRLQLVLFDKLRWTTEVGVGMVWMLVPYLGQWANEVYWIFKAT